MTATILTFPIRPRIQLECAADALTEAITLPTRNEQLAQLFSDIDALTQGYEEQRLYDFLARLDAWDASSH
ncbi:hypothetical protein SAMN05192583_0092 [Sphingomonas gellani]|uniref:Uncharacterized protein n=1 Tax=Sphingomonas gellani TaxID=1166340 RepID=A0A1H7Y6S8_9SPHN|nr:hypothetical protein SAMN05192583_0092 [Sphingomonas gellani]